MSREQWIVQLTTAHPVHDVRIFHRCAKALANDGYRIALAAPLPDGFKEDGFRFMSVGRAGLGRWSRLGRNLKALRIMCRPETCLTHFHDPETLFVAAIPLLFGKRVIYDVHEHYKVRLKQSEWIPSPLRTLAAAFYGAAERCILPHLSGVVVTTPQMLEEYAQYVRPGRLALVRNFPAFTDADLDRARASGPPLDVPYILHTGGASGTKAFHVQVAVAEALKKAKSLIAFVNAGPIDLRAYAVDEREALLERAKNAGMLLLGFVRQENLLPWIAHAYAGYASRSDTDNERRGLPTKVYEYFAFGLPTIASDVGETAALVRRTDSGIVVPPYDPAAHADAIMRLANDRALRERLSANALAAASYYHYNTEFAKLKALYAQAGLQPSAPA